MEIRRKGKLYVLIIGGNVTYLRREDMIELHRIVCNALPDGGDGDDKPRREEKLMPRLDRMTVGEEISWPTGKISEACVRATAAMVKRKSGKCFVCKADRIKDIYTIKRIL